MKKIINEFKKFISRGNVLDLAIGVIIGGAFSKIVTSLVNNIFMPIIGLILGGIDFTKLAITFKDTKITYGIFLQNIIDFLIVSFCLFLLVKFINKFHHKKEVKEKVIKSDEVLLLEEIRNLLKNETKNR